LLKRDGSVAFNEKCQKDAAISLDGVTATKTGWQITHPPGTSPKTLRLFELRDHGLAAGNVIFRLRMKTERDVIAYASLSFRPPLESNKKMVSRVDALTKAEGNTNWAWYEVRVPCDGAPGLLGLNLVLQYAGTVWIEDVELLHVPATASNTPKN
jgi:hypothetical protein